MDSAQTDFFHPVPTDYTLKNVKGEWVMVKEPCPTSVKFAHYKLDLCIGQLKNDDLREHKNSLNTDEQRRQHCKIQLSESIMAILRQWNYLSQSAQKFLQEPFRQMYEQYQMLQFQQMQNMQNVNEEYEKLLQTCRHMQMSMYNFTAASTAPPLDFDDMKGYDWGL